MIEWLGRGLALLACATLAPGIAGAQSPSVETVEGLQGVTLRLTPPPGLCRLDPVEDREAFTAMAGLMSGQVLAVWLACPDLARNRAGEAVSPSRWMYLLAQRDAKGRVVSMPDITRQEAFARWAEAWTKDVDQHLERAKQRLRMGLQFDARAEIGQPRIIGPDETAIYLALPGRHANADDPEGRKVASLSGWSLIQTYRVGIGLAENDAGPERFEAMQAEVRAAMQSLDRLSVSTGAK